MADGGGRGGGLGWFLVGLLVGVAGTLATQKIVLAGGEPAHAEAAPPVSGASPAVSDAPAVAKPPAHRASPPGEANSSSRHRAAHDQSPADIADDAAAAGMTSRGEAPVNSGN